MSVVTTVSDPEDAKELIVMKTMNDASTTKVRRRRMEPTWIANAARFFFHVLHNTEKIKHKQQVGFKTSQISGTTAFLGVTFLQMNVGKKILKKN